MARKKDSQALFEVISRNKDKHVQPKFGVPDWMKGRKAESAEDESAEKARESEAPREAPASEPAAATPKPASPPKPTPLPKPTPPRPAVKPLPKPSAKPMTQADEPVFRFDGEQIRLRLSILTAGVSAMGLIIVLLGVFWLGRATAPDGSSSQAEKAQVEPAAPKGGRSDNGGGTRNGGRRTVGPPAPGLQVGKYYLVIQSLQGLTPAKLADAKKIVKFCHDNGVPAMVMRAPTSYHVWSLRPFELSETLSDVGTGYAAEIEALGRKYVAGGGKYGFTQRNRQGKIEGWFLPHRER